MLGADVGVSGAVVDINGMGRPTYESKASGVLASGDERASESSIASDADFWVATGLTD